MHKSYCMLIMQFCTLKYIPNTQGSGAFFKYCQKLQKQLAELNIGDKISDNAIESQFITAFLKRVGMARYCVVAVGGVVTCVGVVGSTAMNIS